jgi:uncharacterized caspase-like protein
MLFWSMVSTHMSHPTSLTEAVKLVARTGVSLTEAVQDAARSGEGCTVIPFPHLRQEARTDREEPDEEEEPEIADQPPHAADADVADVETLAPRKLPSAPAEGRPAARRTLRSLLVRCARLACIGVLAAGMLVAGATPLGSGSQPQVPAAQKRVALVIGNAGYQFTPKLDNPRNDAGDVAAALRKLGFQVVEGFDLDKAAFDRKVRDFAGALPGAEVAVFFYAGHGLQVSGQNYLVPVDAQLANLSALDFEMVRLDLVHRTMEREVKTNILFFDACRHNPLARNLARALGTRSLEIGRGLAQVEAGAGTLISFSTQPGNVALDGTGRNSPFSGALVKQLNQSSDDVGAILIAVRNDVMKETERKQVPWEHSALTGRFYFNPAGPVPAAAPVTPVRSSEAAEAWAATRDTRSVALLEAFVLRYRDTFYAELARARIEELRR